MPVDVEPRRTRLTPPRTSPGQRDPETALRVGLINNMPDSALQSTEAQFFGLLRLAAGTQAVMVRLSTFPELARSAEGQAHTASYWPIEELLAEPLDAVIITGTEPRQPLLSEEPYWQRFPQLIEFAQKQTHASIWSCLAAHAAVETLDGIRRQRVPEKRCGVYHHEMLSGHFLLAEVTTPLTMPHSRWNELSAEALRRHGYTVLSWSESTGADIFVKQHGSLFLFFQGHPEYEDTTLLKEYRRDVGRYLNSQQEHYPTLPVGYLSSEGARLLEAFRSEAQQGRNPQLLDRFPFAEVAAAIANTWKASAVGIYRNWLRHINESRGAASVPEPVSLAWTHE
jgi:homoserine O-succinyltransferase/O-acetyltransferase